MTESQARQIIGAQPGNSWPETRQLYKSRLHQLQLQLVPGRSLTAREAAAEQIAELQQAFTVLQEIEATQDVVQPPPAYAADLQGHGRPAGPGRRLQHRRSLPDVIAMCIVVGVVGFVVVLLLLTLIAALTRGAGGSSQLRILSSPWCYVEVDGHDMGTSGQSEVLQLRPGMHRLTFRRDDEVWSQTIRLPEDQQTIVKVWFDERKTDVSHQPHTE